MVIFLNKDRLIRKLLLLAALFCFILCIVLVVWYFLSEINFFEEKYWQYINWLTNLENKVAALPNKWLIILVILLLYFVQTVFPVIPISILCVASAMVFDTASCFVINVTGLALLFSVRYSTGMRVGGGSGQWIVRKNKFLQKLVESEGQGNPWVLAVIRLLPVMPINPISQLYGAMDFPLGKYMWISILCFIPKLISYFIIGNNFANPFASEFILLMIIISLMSGIAFLCLRSAWDFINKVKDK